MAALEGSDRRRRSRHRVFWKIVNPPIRRFAGYAPWWALLETRGWKSGMARTTPLARGPRDGNVLWFYSAHGRNALWVRNLEATPEVRVKFAGRWHRGTATVHEYDEAMERRFNLYARSGARTLGISPTLVRIELQA